MPENVGKATNEWWKQKPEKKKNEKIRKKRNEKSNNSKAHQQLKRKL